VSRPWPRQRGTVEQHPTSRAIAGPPAPATAAAGTSDGGPAGQPTGASLDGRFATTPGGSALVRNTALNLVGIAAPLLVGMMVMPIIARNLGPARFGLLGLAWALLEYFSIFDAGLGRATTRFVAERLAAGGRGAGDVVFASLLAQGALGVAAGAVLAAVAPVVATDVLDLSAPLAAEAIAVLRVLALTIPLVLVMLGLRGVLEAAQRFDLTTLVRIPSSSLTFLVPAAGAAAGMSLPTILVLLLVARAATCATLALLIRRAVPDVRWEGVPRWGALRPLLSFGSWAAVSNFVNPLLIYLDRFVLGAVAGLAAVGFYTGPYELTTRLLIVPASFGGTIFAAVSAAAATASRETLGRLFAASVRNLALIMVAPVAVLVAFAPDVLTAWLGGAFAAQGATALRILAFGVLVNALAHVPNAYLQAIGRPDITAKAHLFELAVHVPVTWLLVARFGIAGAAAAWATRVSLDAVLLFVAAARAGGAAPAATFDGRGARVAVGVVGLALALGAAGLASPPSSAARALGAVVAATAFGLFVWRGVLDGDERRHVASLLGLAR
jgi:O-antigen/teichoic acid export membrane protein